MSCLHGHPFSQQACSYFSYTSGKFQGRSFSSRYLHGGSSILEYTNLLTLVTILTGLLMLWLPSEKKLIGHFLGKISYSLYLIHLPVIILLAEWMKPVGMIDQFPNCSIIILILSSIVCSIPFYYFLENPQWVGPKSSANIGSNKVRPYPDLKSSCLDRFEFCLLETG